MSSNHRPPLKKLPRVPFASPASDTVIGSPGSLASSRTEHTYTQSPRRNVNVALDSVSGRNRPRIVTASLEQAMGSSVVPRQGQDGLRSKLPELNVITNFKASGNTIGDKQHSRQESIQVRRNMSQKIRNKDAMKGPIGSLRRADSRNMELSPSDATLLIGLQIPSADFVDTRKAPQGLNAARSSLAVNQRSVNKEHPVTPEIVITPAKLEQLWPANSNQAGTQGRQRAASSIYSQMFQTPYGDVKMPSVPPMPVLPSQSLGYVGHPTSDSFKAERRRPRVDSWGTEIDDDMSPESASHARPYSGDSQLKMLRRSSGDTLATRHRSRGWWNQILSPFLDRSNTTMTKRSMAEDGNNSALTDELKIPFSLSPESTNEFQTPETHGKEVGDSGRSSVWTDMSRWEADRRILDYVHGVHAGRSRNKMANYPSMGKVLSPEFMPVAGFGAASEYYEACWHDENSPTVFFKCQNHDCSLNRSIDRYTLIEEDDMRDLEESPPVHSDNSRDMIMIEDTKDTFRQIPANRFSAAFAEVRTSRGRPMSEATEFEEDPDTTPEVQEARVAPIIRARSPIPTIQPLNRETLEGSSRDMGNPESDQKAETVQQKPFYPLAVLGKPRITVMPPNPFFSEEDSGSPQAITPGLERALSTKQALPMSHVSKDVPLQLPQNIYRTDQYHSRNDEMRSRDPLAASGLFPPPPTKPWNKADEKRYVRETKEERPKSGPWQRLSHGGDQAKQKKKKKRRRCCCLIITGLFAMIALILALCLTLTRRHSDIPVQSSWLNITGYPPIPTGIATIARPDATVEQSGCVQPQTMWSCSLPKEQQASIEPSDPDQPSFRVEIRFDNGSVPTNSSAASSRKAKRNGGRSGNTASAAAIIRKSLLRIRDSFTTSLYSSVPPPPTQQDQVFLGNTTDGNAAPFDGEYTPFFMSFLSTTPAPSRLARRQNQDSNSTDPFPNLTSIIPQPSINSDGTAAAATLLPFPSAQPLRLYNRGLPTEHYGFYNYFDRSIFLKSDLVNASSNPTTPIPDDENGGSPEDAASVRCTWAQTRFLVQIWTRQGTLLPGNGTSSASAGQNATASSANDFSRPGSFPYPISVTLDRHGGDLTTKMIYCYGLDNSEHIIVDEKRIQLEDREFGGTLVNPAMGAFGNVNATLAQGGPGGIDGGTGGCECQWRNWA